MIDIKPIAIETLEKLKVLIRDEEYRKYIILGVGVVVAVLLLFFMVMPQIAHLGNIAKKITEIKNNTELVENRITRLDQMSEKLRDLRVEYEGYANGLPGEKEIPEFLEELSAIARKSNVKILSITPSDFRPFESEGKGKDFLKEMPVAVTAQSGYHELGGFISDLEQAKRFVTIEKVSIKQDNKVSKQHNVEIVLKTYVSFDNEKK
ncbi:MAG: type 4a pilus biogenesis protein PilO [Candidatus Omnitrophica bacterium]|nr:type 4a pilus biogenesis protein PilO [Candidatus Omnitrophota bacterium]